MKLVPFPDSSTSVPGLEIQSRLEVQPKGFSLMVEITGESVARILCAERKAHPERRDELWKTTCFEVFFSVAHTSRYYEFNGSPNGDWALYEFSDYRTGGKKAEVTSAPKLEIFEKGKDRIFCSWTIPFFTQSVLEKAGITAVVEEESASNRISYWALKHVGTKPDFHKKESFIHHLL